MLHHALRAASARKSLLKIIQGLGLTSNLELVLDVGDSTSYNAAVQTNKWLDTSSNGFDFFRGSGTGSDAADPTFNGSAGGLDTTEYWSFDGGDYFTYDTTNETWMNNLHKDNATYTLLCVFDYPTGANQVFFSTRGANLGMNFNMTSTGSLQITIYNATSQVNLGVISTLSSVSGWNVAAVSVNESAGTGVFMLNGSTETFTSTYTGTLTTSNPTVAAKIATRANAAALTALNGAKMAAFAAWEGTALTAQNLVDIYNQLKPRMNV